MMAQILTCSFSLKWVDSSSTDQEMEKNIYANHRKLLLISHSCNKGIYK